MVTAKYLIKMAAALAVAAALSGCVVAPAWGPYYRPHPYWGY